jgi:hypothetical protein
MNIMGYEAARYALFLGFLSPYVIRNIPSKSEEMIDAFECTLFLFRNRVFMISIPGPEN